MNIDELPDLMTTPRILLSLDLDPLRLRISGATYVHKDRIASIPGSRFVGRGYDYWTIPRSWAALKQVSRLFGSDLDWQPEAAEWANSMWTGRVEPALSLRNQGAQPEWVEAVAKVLPAGIQPRDYQVAGAIYLATAEKAGLFDDQGTGKMTQTALLLNMYPDMYPVCIMCPKGVVYTWQRELAKFNVESVVIDGGAADRRKQFDAFNEGTAKVLIISYGLVSKHSRVEGFGTIKLSDEHKTPKELNETEWVTVVADEAHRLKDPSAVQTRAAWAVRAKARNVWPMTGTPIEEDIIDFWALLHFMDPVEWPSKTKFIDMYVMTAPNYFGGVQILGLRPDAEHEFREITDWHWRRVLKGDDLPPRTYDIRYPIMDAKSTKAYNDMKKQLMAELDSDGSYDTLFAANHMVKTGRLLQMASSAVKIDANDQIEQVEPSWKLNEVEDAMTEYEGKPIIFWFTHRDLLHLWEKRLEKKNLTYVSVHGDITGKDRDEAIQSFQRGDVDYILLTYGAGSEGTTLTRSPVAFRVQRPWSSIQDKQAPDRNHRIGSEIHEKITYVDFVTKGTVEEEQREKLQSKEEATQEVLRDSQPTRLDIDNETT